MSSELQISNRWKDRRISPERTKVWVEPVGKKMVQKRVAVVYYLTRNGQLQHPHFMEVSLSNPRGLFLKDVITRLTILRGEGMACMYSWSCKRGYGNGFVWQDLTENDFIYPTNGHEYVLKGSELLHLLTEGPPILNHASESGSSVSSRSSDIQDSSKQVDSPVVIRRKNQSCSSIEMYEYKVYKTTANSVSVDASVAANASTQTESNRHREKDFVNESEKETEIKTEVHQQDCDNEIIELSRGEISPPLSDSSPETLETLMKADQRLMLRTGALNGNGQDQASGISSFSKMKASTVLMQLISCGSFPFKDCGVNAVKDLSLVSNYKSKLPRAEKQGSSTRVKMEEKEYFSGSLIQKKSESDEDLIKLKRSFSYNADRKSRLGLEEMDKVPKGTSNHQ